MRTIFKMGKKAKKKGLNPTGATHFYFHHPLYSYSIPLGWPARAPQAVIYRTKQTVQEM